MDKMRIIFFDIEVYPNLFVVLKLRKDLYGVGVKASFVRKDTLGLANSCERGSKDFVTKQAVTCYQKYLVPYNHGDSMDEFFKSMLILEDIEEELKGKDLIIDREKDRPFAEGLIEIIK